MGRKVARASSEIAARAARQHGVVTTADLIAVGLSSATIARWTAEGRLHRLHRGVYAVGHRGLSVEGRWMAGVLACGPTAVLSHRSAAGLWRLLDPVAAPVHVSVPSGGGRARRAGIRLHRRGALGTPELTWRNRIPVTSPSQTLVDLRSAVEPAELRRALRQAEALGMETELKHRPDPTRSELEDRFLALCRRHRIPKPEVNRRVGGFEVDFLWADRRLIVETDGYAFHRGRSHFESDRRRDLELRRLGYDVLRLSYSQVLEEAGSVAASLRAALG